MSKYKTVKNRGGTKHRRMRPLKEGRGLRNNDVMVYSIVQGPLSNWVIGRQSYACQENSKLKPPACCTLGVVSVVVGG